MMKRKLATLMILLLGMAFSGNVGAIEQSQTGKVDIHGFITQGYLVTDENNFMADTEGNGTFQFNEAGINFASDVSERLRLGVQFIARDLGKSGNKDVSIDWAVADYSVADWLNVRAGKCKMSHGLYNYERDVDMLRTFVFLPQSFYYEGWRDSVNALNGVGAYGYVPMGVVGNLTYHTDLGYTSVKVGGGEVRQLEETMPKILQLNVTEVDTDTTFGGQLAWDTIFGIDGLKIVGGGFNFEMNATSDLIDGTVSPLFDQTGTMVPDHYIYNKESRVFNLKLLSTAGSIEYARGNFVFAAEYMNTAYEMTLPTTIAGVIHKKFDAIGYYGSLTYRFTDWLELGAYYSEYYRDKDDKNGKKAVQGGDLALLPPGQEHAMWLKDLCLSSRFDITPNWIFKLEGHMMDGAALMYSSDDNALPNGSMDSEQDWYLMAAKISYSF
ncbi:MAG: hypothetical protein WC799_02830 [Desulfobacteraceae bacterium]